MAKKCKPRGILERREQQDLELFSGVTSRSAKIRHNVLPGGMTSGRGKASEFLKQLRAKQLAKRMYGILERQFRNYFFKASRMKGSMGVNLLLLLECRLDNVVFRLGFARTRKEARQLVSHRNILVNNQSINIPSYLVKVGDVIAIDKRSEKQVRIQEALALSENREMPEWIGLDKPEKKGTIRRLPERDDMPNEINELLIVEFYSK